MHTDREASDEDGRPALPPDPAPAEPIGTPGNPASHSPASHSPSPHSPDSHVGSPASIVGSPASHVGSPASPGHGASHEYGYGEAEELPAPGGPEPAPPAGLSESGDPCETERRSVTGVQGVTAPRAMLRPVPEGFPTPPPRPARPNRRPAKAQDPFEAKGPRRGLLVGAVVLVAVLVLAVAVGGGILAFRALNSDGPEAAPAGTSAAGEDPGAGGSTTIDEVQLTAVSTEAGVRSVGTGGTSVEPDGEFVIVTVEVANQGDRPVSITADSITLESSDGSTHPLDLDASREHTADSEAPGLVPGGTTTAVHLVFDVPIGTEASALRLDLGDDLSGTLPLAG